MRRGFGIGADAVDLRRDRERLADDDANALVAGVGHVGTASMLLRAVKWQALGPGDGSGDDRHVVAKGEEPGSGQDAFDLHRQRAGSFGVDAEAVARLEGRLATSDRLAVHASTVDREGADPADDPAQHRDLEQLDLGHVLDPSRAGRAGEERVEVVKVVRDEDERPSLRHVVLTLDPEAEQDTAHGNHDLPDDPEGAGSNGAGDDVDLARLLAHDSRSQLSRTRRSIWRTISSIVRPSVLMRTASRAAFSGAVVRVESL